MTAHLVVHQVLVLLLLLLQIGSIRFRMRWARSARRRHQSMENVDRRLVDHQTSLERIQWQLLAAQMILDLLMGAGLVSALVRDQVGQRPGGKVAKGTLKRCWQRLLRRRDAALGI